MTVWRTRGGHEPKWSGAIPRGPWCIHEDRTDFTEKLPEPEPEPAATNVTPLRRKS